MVERDDRVEQHQVHVQKVAVLGSRKLQCRLRVLNVIVGEVADQTAGKRRKPLDLRALKARQDFADRGARVLALGNGLGDMALAVALADPQAAVRAGDLEQRAVGQEGPSAPALVLLGAFEQECVVAVRPQRAHHLDRGEAVRQEFLRRGDHAVIAGRRDLCYFIQGREHMGPPFLAGLPCRHFCGTEASPKNKTSVLEIHSRTDV